MSRGREERERREGEKGERAREEEGGVGLHLGYQISCY